jgi:hypothetical protein
MGKQVWVVTLAECMCLCLWHQLSATIVSLSATTLGQLRTPAVFIIPIEHQPIARRYARSACSALPQTQDLNPNPNAGLGGAAACAGGAGANMRLAAGRRPLRPPLAARLGGQCSARRTVVRIAG